MEGFFPTRWAALGGLPRNAIGVPSGFLGGPRDGACQAQRAAEEKIKEKEGPQKNRSAFTGRFDFVAWNTWHD